MFVLHFITTIDCNRTFSSFAQHEALKADLEGSRQEIDRLSSELEQSRQQSHDLDRRLTEKESRALETAHELVREKEKVQEMLQEKEVLLEKLLQEKAGLANLKQQQRDIIQQHHEDLHNLEHKTQLLKKGMQEYTALNVKVTSISDV